MNIMKTLLFSVLILCITAINVPPYSYLKTNSFCTKHFEMTGDGNFALCSSSSQTKILKYNSTSQNFENFQLIYSNSFIQGFLQLTKDGLIAAFIVSYQVKVFYRPNLSSQFSLIQTIPSAYHFHVSENHKYLVKSHYNSAHLYQFSETSKIFSLINTFNHFPDSAVKINDQGNVIVGTDPYDDIQIVYKPPGSNSFTFVSGDDYNIRFRNCEVNFDHYPKVYISGSSYSNYYNFINKFDATTGQITLLANFTLKKPSSNYAIYADKSQFSKDAKYISFITHTSGYGYAFGKLQNDVFTLITNSTHWENLNGAWDISFRYVPSRNKQYHTITYTSGTQFYSRALQDQSTTLNCQDDEGSTGIVLQNDECQCIYYHYWNKQNKKCLPHCHRPLASGVDSSNSSRCQCKSPAIWNDQLKDCYLNCVQLPHTTGQYESPEVCSCQAPALWNQSSLACEAPVASLMRRRVRTSTKQHVTCPNNQIYDSQKQICLPDCRKIQYSTGNLKEDNTCQCQSEYLWDSSFKICSKYQCENIEYVQGPSEDHQQCVCQDNFEWISQQQKCILKCDELDDQLGTGVNHDDHSCKCKQTASWYQGELKCLRDCENIDNALGNIDGQTCQCEQGYQWNPVGKCDKQQKEKVSSGATQDNCEQNMAWNADKSVCQCKEGFELNKQTKKCEQIEIEGAVIPIAVVGGAAISGLVAFGGAKYIQKRKREEQKNQNEKQDGSRKNAIENNQNIEEIAGGIMEMTKQPCK